MQQILPDGCHGNEERCHRQKVDRAKEGFAPHFAFDEKRHAEAEKNGSGCYDRGIDGGVLKRDQKRPIAEEFGIIFQPDEFKTVITKLEIGQAPENDGGCRQENEQHRQNDGGSGKFPGKPFFAVTGFLRRCACTGGGVAG